MKANKYEGNIALKILFGEREGKKEMTFEDTVSSISSITSVQRKKVELLRQVMLSFSWLQLEMGQLDNKRRELCIL